MRGFLAYQVSLAALLSVSVLVGCGPEQSAVDQEKKERGDLFQKEKARIDTLEGVYESDLEPIKLDPLSPVPKGKSKKLRARLELYSYILTVVTSDKAELRAVPSYLAIVNLIDADGKDSEYVNWIFNVGSYYEYDNRIILTGPGNGSIPMISMIMNIEGGDLVGKLIYGRYKTPVHWVRVN